MNRPLTIFNDVHLGVTRGAGTTLASASALRTYLEEVFLGALLINVKHDVLIQGDLFDGFSVDSSTWITTYRALATWLLASGNTLYLVQGNHDWSAKGEKISSFHLLAEVLRAQFPTRVKVFGPEFSQVKEDIFTIPHCANQDLFDMELQKALDFAPVVGTPHLLLHCNVMNEFADRSDHSLNLTPEWAEKLTAHYKLVVAHEHQKKTLSMGKGILVMGNQWPSSISDCLSKADQNGAKFWHTYHFDTGIMEEVKCWTEDSQFGYQSVDWRDLSNIPEDVKFIRVAGTATSAEASDVISSIARLRSQSDAFVITNAVKVEGVGDMEQMAEVSLEEIQSFNVLDALMEELDPSERKIILEIMAK